MLRLFPYLRLLRAGTLFSPGVSSVERTNALSSKTFKVRAGPAKLLTFPKL
jgi:hypothetical protein